MGEQSQCQRCAVEREEHPGEGELPTEVTGQHVGVHRADEEDHQPPRPRQCPTAGNQMPRARPTAPSVLSVPIGNTNHDSGTPAASIAAGMMGAKRAMALTPENPLTASAVSVTSRYPADITRCCSGPPRSDRTGTP